MMQLVHPRDPDDEEVLRHFFACGGTVRMLADIKKDDVEQLYAYATQLFESGDVPAARNIYYLLVRIDQWHFNCWLALGLCNQRLNRHDEAVVCFSHSGMITVDDPRSSYFSGISHCLLGHVDCARKAFNAAIQWCNQRPEHAAMQRSAAQLLAHCAVAGEV